MRVPAQMRRQKEWVLPQHRFRMPAKKVARAEQTEEKWPRQRQPDTERYLLPIDRQTRRSFKTLDQTNDAHQSVECLFCTRVHLINLKTGALLVHGSVWK
jgi:hypothetical protein